MKRKDLIEILQEADRLPKRDRRDFLRLALGSTALAAIPSELQAQFATAFWTPQYQLWVCGLNAYGNLGLGDTSNRSRPVQLRGWWTEVHGCDPVYGRRPNGTWWKWSDNSSGAYGDGTTTSVSSPTQLAGTTWTKLDGGWGHAGGIKSDNSLWMTGRNGLGELGIGTSTDISSWTQVPGSWSKLALGGDHSAAIRTDGTLWTWGRNNDGQLGIGTSGNGSERSSPVQVAGSWIQVAAGDENTYGIRSDYTLWVWGQNDKGQLGQNNSGNPNRKSSPVQVAGSWLQVAAKTYGAPNPAIFGIKTNNTLWAWGANADGQLGIGSTSDVSVPTQVAGSWAYVYTSSVQCLAQKTDKTTWIWGDNAYGSLGLGDTASRSSPVQLPGAFSTQSKIFSDCLYLLRVPG